MADKKQTGVAMANPNKQVAQTKATNAMVANQSKVLTTSDGKTFDIAKIATDYARAYKSLIPAHSNVQVPLELHTFFTKLMETRKGTQNMLVNTVTAASIEKSCIDLLKSGMSLSDKQAFLIPYGDELQFKIAGNAMAAQAAATVLGGCKITSFVVFKGEKITSRIENEVEIFDHQRDMSKRIDGIENVAGVYTYAKNDDGVIFESGWKDILKLCRDWLSNNKTAFRNDKTGKKEYPSTVAEFKPYLSENHIYNTEAMAKKTGIVSLSTLIKTKYPHNPILSKYLNDVIQSNTDAEYYEDTISENAITYDIDGDGVVTPKPVVEPKKQAALALSELPDVDDDNDGEMTEAEKNEAIAQMYEEEQKQDCGDYETADKDVLTCADCGTDKITAKNAEYSQKKYKLDLCWECQQKRKR